MDENDIKSSKNRSITFVSNFFDDEIGTLLKKEIDYFPEYSDDYKMAYKLKTQRKRISHFSKQMPQTCQL